MPADRPPPATPTPARAGQALATLLTALALTAAPAAAALAEPTGLADPAGLSDPAQNVIALAGRIAAVDDELAQLAETFAVLDVREAEVRRELDRATSRVDRLTAQRAAATALHRTQLDLAHRRTTFEQVDEALHLLATRSGLTWEDPGLGVGPGGADHGTAPADAAADTLPADAAADTLPAGAAADTLPAGAAADTLPAGGGSDLVRPAAAHARDLPAAGTGPPTATSASVRSGAAAAAHAGHLQLRYAIRASMLLTTLHLQLGEAEAATVAPRRELDTEVAPSRARLQERLQELLDEREELAGSLAIERTLLDRAERLQLPVTAAHRVSSRFGMRRHPIHGDLRMHTGLDLAAPIGTPVSAAAAGRVVAASSRGGYGLTVDVDHGGGLLTRYAHLDRIEVERGDRLAAGQRLGTVGMTGTVTGPHLHLEVREHGRAVDPAEWLSGAGGAG